MNSARSILSIFRKLGAGAALILVAAVLLAPSAGAAEPLVTELNLAPSSTVAGAHGNLEVTLGLATGTFPPETEYAGQAYSLHSPQTATVNLPPGVLADPTALPSCSNLVLTQQIHACPDAAQVGVIDLYATQLGGGELFPLFNATRGPDEAARFAFTLFNGISVVNFRVHLRDDSDYGATVTASEVPATFSFYKARLQIWGHPAAHEHDLERASCFDGFYFNCEGGKELASAATFLVNPPTCKGGTATAAATFYDLPGQTFEGPLAFFPALTGCSTLPFEPSLTVAPPEGSLADQPAGYAADLTIPQTPNEEVTGQASAFLKDLTLKLPAGTAISPAVAQGLGTCTDAELGFGSHEPVTCPEDSRIGTVSVGSPLLDRELEGSVYVGSQASNDPASGDMYRVFLVPEGAGIRAKLVGHLAADPATGQLTATFANNPQVPFDHLHLQLNGGPRAPLADPPTCGNYSTSGELVPWSTPETPTRSTTSSFSIGASPGGACASSEGGQPNTPSLEAETASATAGAASPLNFRVSRADGTQRIRTVDATLPEGLLAKLSGIPYCSAAQIAAAEGQTGAQAQASPACPSASQVGSVDVTAGPGVSPLSVPGKVYLAGPYKGAPLSLAIVTPAVAGPFDLGTVVVRAALEVDPATTQVTVHSDPIPTIVKGVPLDLRSIALDIDRSDFTRNPTSCEQTAIDAGITSPAGGSASRHAPFAASDCEALAFSPKLRLVLSGPTGRGGHPSLKATLRFPAKRPESDTASAQVALPHSEFLDQGNIGKVCGQADLKAGTCPAESVYGHAVAYSPLLEKPLEGDVYLAVGFGHKLPDLVADLDGQIRVLLDGRIDTDPQGGIRTTFSSVPDAPISRFVLELKGGKKGLLENSESVCARSRHAGARFMAHDGSVYKSPVLLAARCGKRR